MKITARIHYGPIGEILAPRSVDPAKQGDGIGFLKPGGLWYSVHGTDDIGDPFYTWEDWCVDEQPSWLNRNAWTLDIDAGRILTIRSADQFDLFCHGYHAATAPHLLQGGIDWSAVACDYQGLEIAPYRSDRRISLDCMWYHGWDCASGVIWNMSALTGWTRTENLHKTRTTEG